MTATHILIHTISQNLSRKLYSFTTDTYRLNAAMITTAIAIVIGIAIKGLFINKNGKINKATVII